MPAPSLILTCPVGLEDLVRGDLREGDGVPSRLIAPGLIDLDRSIDRDALPAMVSRAAIRLGGTSAAAGGDRPTESAEREPRAGASLVTPAELVEALRAVDWPVWGISEPVRFRIHLPGRDQERPRAQLSAAVERDLGWVNAPDDWQLNLDISPEAVESGGARAELGPWAWAARFGALQRRPATTPGAVAAGLLRLAKARPGDTVLDPCGGVATIGVVDALTRGGPAISIDLDTESVAAARANQALVAEGALDVQIGDATKLTLADGSVHRVVSDLPFGKRIGSNEANRTLYPAILREIERVLAADGRCVLLTDDKRVFVDAVARARGLKVVGERVIRYNGVAPSAYIVTRSRRPRGSGRTR